MTGVQTCALPILINYGLHIISDQQHNIMKQNLLILKFDLINNGKIWLVDFIMILKQKLTLLESIIN